MLDDKLLEVNNAEDKQAVLQIRDAYYPRYIRLACDDLGIDVPDFVKTYEKNMAQLNRGKGKGK